MNIFASLIRVKGLESSKVTYYSVVLNEITHDETRSEFYNFLNRMEQYKDHLEDLNKIIIFLEQEIGDKYGAREDFFRPEQFHSDLTALPPNKGKFKTLFIGTQLRLYTLRLNESVVILFNGGVKTAQTAQECTNVREYFLQANKIAGIIDDLLKEQEEIQWNHDFTDITFLPDLKIEF
ncbi:hypothetical protein JM84_2371 [Dokdonia sp. Hel_I_63]|uniref:hypothetical protein n=1 Tax=Dokdonia sp. Hel_I_63 TaxID=1249996 RepID=UPI00119B4D0A|nr:hypothetical protein [Dokdonia sp. Hel_I_63]TVZ23446.1 hypothetical protein JM84_2371 [Dokdonia sp. Hel_I_63]